MQFPVSAPFDLFHNCHCHPPLICAAVMSQLCHHLPALSSSPCSVIVKSLSPRSAFVHLLCCSHAIVPLYCYVIVPHSVIFPLLSSLTIVSLLCPHLPVLSFSPCCHLLPLSPCSVLISLFCHFPLVVISYHCLLLCPHLPVLSSSPCCHLLLLSPCSVIISLFCCCPLVVISYYCLPALS